jgi:flagellar biosynthetic protein FliS
MAKILDDLNLRNIEIEVEPDEQKRGIGEEKNSTSNSFQINSISSEKNFFLNSVKTADPISLLLMCYDLAKSEIRKAIDGIKNKDYEKKYEGISKALKIFDVLMATTEPNEVGKYLITSYLFITKKITEGSMNLDVGVLEKVIGYIDELESAWKKMMQSNP